MAHSPRLASPPALAVATSRARVRISVATIVTWLLITAGAALFLFPFAWMLSTSLKAERELFAYPIRWLPASPQFGNFPEAWRTAPFNTYAVNTIIITLLNVVGQTASSAICAYAFARLRFRGRNVLFFTVLAVMMLPSQVTIIPLFILFRYLGWVNTFLPLVVPGFFGEAFYIFLLRQFFLTIPIDLEDAARIDGASSLQILLRIMAPLARPAMATVAIFSFIFHWNDFFAPLLYLNHKDTKTLALGLAAFRGEFTTYWHLMMAASILILLPCLILFFTAQKHFIEGISTGGLKD